MSSAPVPTPRAIGASPQGQFVMYPVNAGAASSGRQAPSLADYGLALWKGKWIIAAAILVSVVSAYFVSKKMTKLYESTVTIDIERTPQTGIIGQETNITLAPDMDQHIATHMRLMQSDAVLRPVVQRYDLLRVEEANITNDKAPIRLRKLRVTRPPNTYLVQISYRHPSPEAAAEVANAIATSYMEQLKSLRQGTWSNMASVTHRQLDDFKTRMEESNAELARLQRKLGMVDPEDKTNVLSARLLQLNSDYARAQADLASREATYETVRGGIPEAAEASAKGDALAKLIERRNEAMQKFSDVKSVYGENHPEYRRSQSQLKEVDAQLNQTYRKIVKRSEAELSEARLRETKVKRAYAAAKGEADELSAHTVQYRMVKQRADADRAMYDELARKVNEFQVNQELKSQGVRIADAARAETRPASPNTLVNCAIALIGALMLSGGFVVIRGTGAKTVRSVEEVRATTTSDVVSLLPSVPEWRGRKGLHPKKPGSKLALFRREGLSSTSYFEAMRMLRGRLTGMSPTRSPRVVAVVSAASGDGRSTTAANLATSCANLGRRTLLIDADLRNPTLHTMYFTTPPANGLCEVLSGGVKWKDAVVRHNSKPNLYLLPAGGPNERASELLTDRLSLLLEDVLPLYDLVILDSPPFLRYAETVDIIKAADSVVVVARANHTEPKALATLEQYLERLGSNVAAVALNDAEAKA